MQLASVGLDLNDARVETLDFGSPVSLLDHDGVVLDLENVQYEYFSSSRYRGLRSISESDSPRLVGDIKRRRGEIRDLLSMGRPVVMFTPPPQKCYVDTGQRQHSGTGRNRQTTRIVEEVDILQCLPFLLRTQAGTGTNIEFRGYDLFSGLWNTLREFLVYRAWLEDSPGEPILFIAGTDKAVGCYGKVDRGSLLMLPHLFPPSYYRDETEDEEADEADLEEEGPPDAYLSMLETFTEALFESLAELKEQSGDFQLPDWAARLLLPGERKAREKISALEARQAPVAQELSHRKRELMTIEEAKLLFAGTGPAFESVAKKAFRILGFEVESGARGRDDLLLRHRDRVAVCELKGVKKSAAEKHAAQLEKWVSNYFETNGLLPKGVLVVNAYREKPLEKRNKPTFPTQMLSYSEARGHCLLSGLQLLALTLEAQAHPRNAKGLVDLIFSTAGPLEGYDDWKGFLEEETDDAVRDT